MPSKKILDIRPPEKRENKQGNIKTKREIKKKTEKTSKSKKNLIIRAPSFLKKISLPKNISLSRKFGTSALLLLFLFIVLLHFSAKVEIEIWPKTQSISIKGDFSVDQGVLHSNLAEKIILGSAPSKQETISQIFPATGTTGKQGKASGTITIYNNYDLVQTLVASTRFLSADGKLFRSESIVYVPAGGSRDVKVIAAEPGPEYNIKPSKFAIPGLQGTARYTVVYGESSSSMEGGYTGEISQVTKNDLEKAKDNLSRQLTNTLKEELKDVAGPSFLLLDECIRAEIIDSSCSKQEGDEVNEFRCSVQVKADGLAFSESNFQEIVAQLISENVEGDTLIKQDTLQTVISVQEIDFETGKMFLALEASAEIFMNIDVNLLRDALRGKSLKESRALLEAHPEIEKTKVRLFPFWVQSIPENLKRVQVKLNLD